MKDPMTPDQVRDLSDKDLEQALKTTYEEALEKANGNYDDVAFFLPDWYRDAAGYSVLLPSAKSSYSGYGTR